MSSGSADSRHDVSPERDAAPDVPLRRNRGFQLLWTGSVFAFLGKEIAELAYPLVVLAVTGSPGWAGAFGGVQIFTSLLCGVPAGELADRYDRRRLLLCVEALRALATGSVVAAFLLDSVSLAHLLAVAVVVGAAQPLGGSTRMLLVRSLVPPRQLTAALTQEEVRSHAAALTGPPLGGALYAVAQVVPFLVTAFSFTASLVLTLFVRPPVEAPHAPMRADDKEPFVARMTVGLRALWSRPTLRAGTLFAAAMNTVTAPVILTVVVRLREQGMSSTAIGFTTMGLAVGGLAGTVLVAPLHRLLGPGVLMLWLGGTAFVLIGSLAAPWGRWWPTLALFLLGLGGPSMRVLVDILIFRQVPDEQRGRAVAACMTVFGAGASLGVFAAGQLLEHASGAVAVLVLAGVLAAAWCVGLRTRELRRAQWPEEHEAARAG
ncbi:MFS transporter [Streptomyces sp. NPDC001941]|uniref:MFS transporter n=1 Tax=Streptomyces sp. NPDC001941 TaxID=3154659 RepID=UPI0033237374